MATSDENEEVYLNLRHVTPGFKKKAKLTETQDVGEFPSQHNQAYQGFSSGNNNSPRGTEREKSVHDYMSVKDLVRNKGTPSKPDADTSGTSSVIYERFSDILTPDKCNKEQTKNQPLNTNLNTRVQIVLLISVIVFIVSALLSIAAGIIVEHVISKKFEDEKTEESSRIGRLKSNAEWSDWSNWGSCSASCDIGLNSRDRKCLTQNTTVKEEYCTGLSHQEQICMERPCADGGWGRWGSWGACSLSCGSGIRSRMRQCDNPRPSIVGMYCEGPSTESDVCLLQACPDGVWTPWSSWGPCSATCNGGIRSRTRNCTDPEPPVLGRQCLGSDINTTLCNTDKCKDLMVYFNAYSPVKPSSRSSRAVTITFQSYIGNSSFNSTSGIFTCPVSGLYYFTVNIMTASIYHPYCYIYCRINGLLYIRGYVVTGGTYYYFSATAVAYCQMNSGDQAYIKCTYSYDLITSSNAAFFTGALITHS